MENKNYIPAGIPAVTPMLVIRNADQAIEWYKKVFHARELSRLSDQSGKIVHAEMKMEDCILMIAEEQLEHNKSPITLGGASIILNVYVPDVDKTVDHALQEGATLIFPVNDQFYGDRAGRIQDPFGHMWIVSKHIKDVGIEELQQQMKEMAS